MRYAVFLLLVAMGIAVSAANPADEPPLVLEARIPLGAVSGGIDEPASIWVFRPTP